VGPYQASSGSLLGGLHLSSWPDIIFIVANAALAGVEGKDQPELCRTRAVPFRTPSAKDRCARSDFRLDLTPLLCMTNFWMQYFECIDLNGDPLREEGRW
jgi:hypothetical protein